MATLLTCHRVVIFFLYHINLEEGGVQVDGNETVQAAK